MKKVHKIRNISASGGINKKELKKMTEDFLHFIWKSRLFSKELLTAAGEHVQILHPGQHNRDGGPDFSNARIRIGDTIWAGNLEVHIRSSDWYKHMHQDDKNYDNIILHVVFESDADVFRRNGELIPCLPLKGMFNMYLYAGYLDIISSGRWVPCENLLKDLPAIIREKTLETVLIEKIKLKAVFIRNALKKNMNNWEQTFYEQLARNFGFKLNSETFELLAKSVPLKHLSRHKNNLLQLEAMLYGQGGFLQNRFKEEYPLLLQREYRHMKHKFTLQVVHMQLWQHLRLRPPNFPCIRISQFAALVHKSSHLFSKIIEVKEVEKMIELFETEASPYWDNHHIFEKKTDGKARRKKLGRDSIYLILINTVIPFLFIYGEAKADVQLKERSLDFLARLPSEDNRITRKWKQTGIPIKSAFDSQALLHLKTAYCDNYLCLECQIGYHLLRAMDKE